VTAPADGFVYGPTPLEAADHIEKWEAMRDEGVVGLPEWPVELNEFGWWKASLNTVLCWGRYDDQNAPKDAYRLVPLPVVPPVPVVVKVEDANDAQALIGRSIDGEEIEMAWTTATRFGFCDEDGDAIINRAWGGSVTVDPEPPPAPVEPDTVTVVEAARALLLVYGTEYHAERTAIDRLRAALAAEGDRR